MTMLTAAEVLKRHPQGCWVVDATGRHIPYVEACNPETGEVIRMDGSWLTGQWLRLTCRGLRFGVASPLGFRWASPSGGVIQQHGFWPAPLRVVPKQRGGLLTTPEPQP